MIRHLVFADCAALVNDIHMKQIFMGMAYGIHPFCVSENKTELVLIFRRAMHDRGGDKQKRLLQAVDALAQYPGIRAYNDEVGDGNGQIHVDANQTISWSIH